MTATTDQLAPAVQKLARRVFAGEPLFRPSRLGVWDAQLASIQGSGEPIDADAQAQAAHGRAAGRSQGPTEEEALAATAQDFLVVDTDAVGEWPAPADVFPRLTWGGQLLLVARDRERLEQVAKRYDRHDCFDLETPPTPARRGLKVWVPRRHYALIRRVTLLAPGQHTDRSTFDVRLVRDPRLGPGYVVRKQVPTHRRVAGRLHERYPDATADLLLARATKLVNKVFPVFLTREAGFLQVLAKELPPEYRQRVPQALGMEKAADGTVKRLYMTWLRMDRAPMDQLDFALQATELLSVVHDVAKVIHLDLRLDNMVISDGEVCFIDFGSSVQVGENVARNPMLHSLFEEMMNTSQIQRTMGRMKDTGRLTSDVLLSAHGKMDRAVDMFYLSLQITHPVTNPELRHLIQYKKGGVVATAIKELVAQILRPPDPERPQYISAADVHRGLQGLASGKAKGKGKGSRRGRKIRRAEPAPTAR